MLSRKIVFCNSCAKANTLKKLGRGNGKNLVAKEKQKKNLKNEALYDQYVKRPCDVFVHEIFKPLPYFPLKSCVKCWKCLFIAHAVRTLQNHVKTCELDLKNSDEVLAQTSFRGNNILYFEVFQRKECEDFGLPPNFATIHWSFGTLVSLQTANQKEVSFHRSCDLMSIFRFMVSLFPSPIS